MPRSRPGGLLQELRRSGSGPGHDRGLRYFCFFGRSQRARASVLEDQVDGALDLVPEHRVEFAQFAVTGEYRLRRTHEQGAGGGSIDDLQRREGGGQRGDGVGVGVLGGSSLRAPWCCSPSARMACSTASACAAFPSIKSSMPLSLGGGYPGISHARSLPAIGRLQNTRSQALLGGRPWQLGARNKALAPTLPGCSAARLAESHG